jgi:hypothetical protein
MEPWGGVELGANTPITTVTREKLLNGPLRVMQCKKNSVFHGPEKSRLITSFLSTVAVDVKEVAFLPQSVGPRP